MKNVLITGAFGFVGSTLALRLIHKPEVEKIICISSRTPRVEENLHADFLFKSTKVVIEKCDIRDTYSIIDLFNKYEIDTVFHFGAVSIVKQGSFLPTRTLDVNIRGTWNVLEAARISKTVTSMVGISSDKAYGDSDILPYKEDFKLNGLNVYDASKSCADILMRMYANNYNLNVSVLRPCNIYGPGDTNFSRIIPNTLNRLYHNESPILYDGVGEYFREFIYIDDVIDALLLVQEGLENHNISAGEAFNVGTGEFIRIKDLINMIIDTHGEPYTSIIEEGKASEFKEIKDQFLDSSKICAMTGWRPSVTLSGGIVETYDWYMQLLKRKDRNNG